MIPGYQNALCLFSYKKCTKGNAAADGLCNSDHIRLYPILFIGEHGTGPSHTALDLVQDQQQILLLTELLNALDKCLISRMDPALSLNRLQDDGTGPVIYKSLYTFQIIVDRKADPGNEWAESFPVFRITGYRQSSHAPSMEAVLHGDHLMVILSVL